MCSLMDLTRYRWLRTSGEVYCKAVQSVSGHWPVPIEAEVKAHVLPNAGDPDVTRQARVLSH